MSVTVCAAASIMPFGHPDGAPESPTGSDEATGCAVDLQRIEQRRVSSQLPPRVKVRLLGSIPAFCPISGPVITVVRRSGQVHGSLDRNPLQIHATLV